LEGVRGILPVKIKGLWGVECIAQIYKKWGQQDLKGIVEELNFLLSVIKRYKDFQRDDWTGKPKPDTLRWRRFNWYRDIAITIWAAAALVEVTYEEVAAEVFLLRGIAENSLGLRLPEWGQGTLSNPPQEIGSVDKQSMLRASCTFGEPTPTCDHNATLGKPAHSVRWLRELGGACS
jgi:hypothetical protein